MNERLIRIMEYYAYSPSIFADEIGVLRSSISHIVSGRNKPGIDLIQKVLNRFPELSTDWLVLGRGQMLTTGFTESVKADTGQSIGTNTQALLNEATLKDAPVVPAQLSIFDESEKSGTSNAIETEKNANNLFTNVNSGKGVSPEIKNSLPELNEKENPSVTQIPSRQDQPQAAKVKRITLFYSDNSYQDFLPE